MSCYPPTPAFGNFNFAPQKAAVVSNSTDVPSAPASSNTVATAAADARRVTGILPSMQRQPILSKTDTVTAPPTERAPPVTMNTHDESSDSLEEGELSEAQSLASPSSSIGMNMSGDEGLHPTVDHLPMVPPDKWNTRPRPTKSSRSQPPPPQQNRNGGGRILSKNDRYSAAHDQRTTGDKGKGLNQRGRHPSITQHSHMRGQDSVASTSPQISSLRQAAQAAILDMSLCGVKYDDLIREGYDPVVLGRLFASAGLPVVMNSIPPPSAPPSNEQGSSAPPKVAATKLNRPLPTEKGVLDKDAQVLREKLEKARLDHEKRERREKEQKEAEARASELVRRRQAATEEEERRRREVEVKAKQDIAKKKIATMMSAAKPASPGVPTTTKAASPSVPPTPISSTPVNAAVAAAKPQPNPPAASPSPPMVIPGLLLAPASGTASEVASKAASEVASRAASEATSKATSKAATPESTDVVMSDAPQVAVSNPPSIAAVPTVGAGSNGVSPPQPPPAARRKRPMASDLYSEPNPVRRKFGAQRTSSMIIEVSDDEDDAADATYFTPHESREDQGSPLGTPGIASNGLNHGVRRIVSLPVTAATSQADELRKREADIQRMKARIMAAEQKSMAAQRRKELSKAASNSGHPTPIGTPTVGSDSSAPPPLTTQLAGKHDSVMPTAPPAGLTNDTPIENQRPDVSKKTEMDLEAQQIRARAIEERMRKHREEIAAAEKKKKEEVESAAVNAAAVKAAEAKAAETKKKEEEREKKRRELVALENRRQNKRLEREMLEEQLRRQIAEMRREEEDMEQRHDSLVRDLEDVNIPLQPVAPSNDMQNGSEQMRTEIEAKEKNEGPSGSEELVERQLLVEDVSNSSGNPTPASATASALEGHSQFIGRPEEIVAVAKSLSPVKVAPTAVLKTVDSMDVDESHELATQDKPAPAEDVEMESSCADGTSFGETSGSDDSSDDSSSEEGDEDKDEVMVDKPEETQSNATIQTAVSVSDALPIQTAQPIAPSSPMETNAPTTELASEPARANEPFVVTVPEVALKIKAIPNAFFPYQSPLQIFKSFRHHRNFHDLKPDGLRSLQYSNNIDPDRAMCQYEVCGGVCNDRECEWQHFREIGMKDEQILVELAANEGTTEEEKERFSAGLRDTILQLKQQGIKDFTTVAQGIATFRRKFFGDETRVIKLNPTAPLPAFPRSTF